jgi:hypothetical protein
MKNYETLQSVLQDIASWGEERGAYWCRERARKALNLLEEYPNKKHESHKSVRSIDTSTFDFICDDCGATADVASGWGSLRRPCKR